MADFTKVKPAGWASNDELLYSEMNAFDNDHVASLNRHGGTIDGPITLAAGSSIAASGGSITVSGGQDITITGAGSTVVTASGGRLVCNDGDFTVLNARTLSRKLLLLPYTNGTLGVASNGVSLRQTATAQYAFIPLYVEHKGATIGGVQLFFYPSVSYNGQPAAATQLSVNVQRMDSTAAALSLSSTGAQSFPAPADGTAYYNGGALASLTFSADQNNTVDTASTVWFMTLVGEQGAGYQTGTVYVLANIIYQNITSMDW